MSRLSELLNPAPASASETSAMAHNHPPIQPLVLDGQNHRTSSVSYTGSPTHTRRQSITSPGLEALADAASHTAPMASPTQRTGSFAHAMPFQPSYSSYASRPSSSHTVLPPLSNDHAHAENSQISPSTSSLEPYHYQSVAGERHPSTTADPSARLPPLQHSPTDHIPPPSNASASHPLNGMTEHAGNIFFDATNKPAHLQQDGAQGGSEQNVENVATSQIRQPSQGPSQSIPSTAVPDSQAEQIEVKAEIAENYPDPNLVERPPSAQADEGSGAPSANMESLALKDATDGKKDTLSPMGLDGASGAPVKPKAPSKKRAAPKKGTASAIKPVTKKRKLDNDNVEGTPLTQRSGTPATSRASNTPVPKNRKQGSVTPARSSSVVNGVEEEEGSEEDTEAYCICRKPDDHTLMIGCDGPCEDWFHVRCVAMDSVKAKLISKWYCPNCVEKGFETLWKRMCRLEGCQEPARQDGDNKSKYCCDEHGLEFMRSRVSTQNTETKGTIKAAANRRRRRENYTDNIGNENDDSPDEDLGHLRGGVLKASELKALTDGVADIDAFHRLGDGVLSPPPTASPEGEDIKMENGIDPKKKPIYTPDEFTKLEEIAAKREKVRTHKKLLDDRDRFLLLVTARAKSVLAELKEQDKSYNTICGYDARISWSDVEFSEWRTSPEGKAALEKGGTLPPPSSTHKPPEDHPSDHPTTNNTSNTETAAPPPDIKINGHSGGAGVEDPEPGPGVCKRKRCERHKAWLKLMQQEILFETHQARLAMKKLESEERGVRDRAMVRFLESGEGEGR
ncbi:COMPASS (complex proteins associated with Set1p) component [Lecanora helva]